MAGGAPGVVEEEMARRGGGLGSEAEEPRTAAGGQPKVAVGPRPSQNHRRAENGRPRPGRPPPCVSSPRELFILHLCFCHPGAIRQCPGGEGVT